MLSSINVKYTYIIGQLCISPNDLHLLVSKNGWPSLPPQHLLSTFPEQVFDSICIQLHQGIYICTQYSHVDKKRFVCFGLGIRQRSLILIRCVLVWCFQSYSQTSKENGHADELIEERAPSTAEEFKKMAEEKLRDAQQGVASQTAEKVYDATEEATLGDSDDLQSVKRRYEEHEEGADYRRKSGDQSDGVKALSNKA